ncbi:S8 family peptidase [Ureibacillus sinduriensis]|uniref:Peptidase S8/S53 subtilisin kexin sedolisin n=1 Tax=Ureibacillus sinduriensis BLB-1 = JCM 15800 TaxID=1384057 RepID=A0A0A3HNP2_9BACL|nr:S8 family peptidase [Ureibacillus sinduriensis]KGR74009.1 peptidase S8/S53 subtilisin kexin sedolisin [Ureibacillus sinduriensis BLB-1 = JCM 15800]
MKRPLVIGLISLVLSIPLIPTKADAQLPEERVIVYFKNKIEKTSIGKVKGKIKKQFRNVPALAVTLPASSIETLKKNPNVKLVEKDTVLKTTTQTTDWGITRTAAQNAWQSGLSGKGIKVAVVDTGISRHDDLFVAGGVSTVDYTTSFNDDNGHGTHVAGIVGAENNSIGIVGIAPEADIYAVKSLDNDGYGYLSDIIEGIDWSITNKMDIINLSFGTTVHSPTLQQIVDKAYNQNILVVAAAGNSGSADGNTDTIEYPARYDSVIAVAATDSTDTRVSFSSTGSTLDVAAPGEGIISTYLNNQYARMSGTSMAAPYAAGNLALLKQANSTLSAKDLRIKLQDGVIDLGTVGRDALYGYGIIQAPTMNTAKEPIKIIPVQYNSKTALVAGKPTYKRGETVSLAMTSYNEDGEILAGANAEVVIYKRLKIVKIFKGTTNSNGQFKVGYSTSGSSSLKGKFQVKAITAKEGYNKSESVKNLELR